MILPTDPSHQELDDLIDAGTGTGKAGSDFYFAFKNFIEKTANFISPVDLDPVLIAIIAAIVGVLIIIGIGGDIIKHLLIFFVVLIGLVIVFLVFGEFVQLFSLKIFIT